MKLGVIADDFTGASDIALTLAQGGMRTGFFVGTPTSKTGAPLADGFDAGVIALKSRSIAADTAVALAQSACDWLLAGGAAQIVFKICSTFDSTAEGNIGPVAAALAERLNEKTVLVCPAFPTTGRTVYQGHLFVNDQLLSHSGMENHPINPMCDPDLRRVLARQTALPVGHLGLAAVRAGDKYIAAALESASPTTPSGVAMTITDAIDDSDLVRIGRAAARSRLLVGGSGIALGLPANWGFAAGDVAWLPVTGPGAVLSGSCSEQTLRQVAAYSQDRPFMQVSPGQIIDGSVAIGEIVDWVRSQPAPPLIYSSAPAQEIAAMQNRLAATAAAAATESFFASLATALVAGGVTRLVVAGGETSSAVVEALGLRALTVGPAVAPGVPMLRASAPDLALALKSGNFGGDRFFADCLAQMAGDTA